MSSSNPPAIEYREETEIPEYEEHVEVTAFRKEDGTKIERIVIHPKDKPTSIEAKIAERSQDYRRNARKIKYLWEEFLRNPYPSKRKIAEMGNIISANPADVKTFFEEKRVFLKVSWDSAEIHMHNRKLKAMTQTSRTRRRHADGQQAGSSVRRQTMVKTPKTRTVFAQNDQTIPIECECQRCREEPEGSE